MHGGYVPDGAPRRASATVEEAPPDHLNNSSRGWLHPFKNCREEVFSETVLPVYVPDGYAPCKLALPPIIALSPTPACPSMYP